DFGLTGEGPVAFTREGTPVQLVAQGEDVFVLRDLARRQSLREFVIRPNSTHAAGDESADPALALTTDGALAAARATGLLVVWDTQTVRELLREKSTATVVAFSPDHSLVASGSEDGLVTVRSLGPDRAVINLSRERNAVRCLAFSRDPRRRGQGSEGGWL